jgi:hypothetical protein
MKFPEELLTAMLRNTNDFCAVLAGELQGQLQRKCLRLAAI